MPEKTKYLNLLEELKTKLQGCDKITDDVQGRLRLLGLLFEVEQVTQFFAMEAEKADTNVYINLDYDIDYKLWTNPVLWISGCWMSQKQGVVDSFLQNAWTTSAQNIYDIPSLKGFTKYLPTPFAATYNNQVAEDAVFNMLNILCGKYTNTAITQHMIYQSLVHLCDILNLLNKRLHSPRSDEQYSALAKQLYLRFSSSNKAISEDYESQKKHLTCPLNGDWLEARCENALEELYKSEFMQLKIKEFSKNQAANVSVPFELDGIGKKKTQLFYYALFQFCTYTNHCFSFDDLAHNLAHFIYNYQDKLAVSAQSAFFRFRYIIELIQADMATSPAPTPKPSPQAKHTTSLPVQAPFMTFQKGAMLSDYHIATLRQHLVKQGWIAKNTNPDDFVALFSGKSCICNITWIGGGVGNLYELFRQIKKHNLITIPGGHGLATVLQKHFVNEAGQHLTGLNSGAYAKGHLPTIAECIRILQQSLDILSP